MHARHQVIPIVGNLAGTKALSSVAKFLAASNLKVSAFYTSNVEFYLFRDGSIPAFVANLGRLPHDPGSVIVSSVFPAEGPAPRASPATTARHSRRTSIRCSRATERDNSGSFPS